MQRRTEKKEEALGLKRLPHSLTVASASAAIALAATNAVRAADTLDPAQNSAEMAPIILVQIAAFRGAKGSETANVNVDSKGVILNGYDAVAFFKQRNQSKGIPESRAPIRARHTYLPRQRIKPILTRIQQSMPRSMADFVPTG